MTQPGQALPASNSTNWYAHYQQLDTLTRAVSPLSANRVAFLGDSITSINGTGDNVTTNESAAENYSIVMTTLSNGRMQWARNFATGGLTIAEVRDTVLPRLLAVPTAQLPGTCVVLCGTNDVGQASAPFSLAGSISALTDIVNSLRGALIRPVLCTIPPRGDDITANGLANKLNVRIAWLAQEYGIPLLDFYGALVNGSTGGYTSGLAISDNVHPSDAGMYAMGQYAVTSGLLDWLPPWSPYLVKTVYDTADLTAGWGLFLNDANADGIADNWDNSFAGGAATPSLVAASGGDTLGNWQRVSRSSAGTGRALYHKWITISGNAVAGDLISLDARIRWTGLSDSGITTGVSGASVALEFRNASNAVVDSISHAYSRDISGVVHLERKVPSTGSPTYILLGFEFPGPTTGTAVYDISQVTARNLTALGLA